MSLSLVRQQWIEQFIRWAKSRSDIRAVFLTGSCGRTDQDPADEWSDVDLLFITTKPKLYTKNNSWMRELGSFWTGILPPSETFGSLLPIYCGFSAYNGGLVAEYFILSNRRARWATNVIRLLNLFPALRRWLPENISTLGADAGDLFRQGARILVDKDGFAETFQQTIVSVMSVPSEPPSQEEFQNSLDDFWFGPPKVVADLQRGRLLAAMKNLDVTRRHILEWMEWHARAKNHWQDDDMIYRHSRINQWADPRVIAALPNIYAFFDADDIWKALFALMDLSCWLAPETAQLLGYEYSSAGQQITDWARKCFDENFN
jgi:aminoglycoside 6-adenylyltransferase